MAKNRLNRYLPSIAIAIVGITVSIAFAWFNERLYQEAREQDERALATKLVRALQSLFDLAVSQQTHVNALLAASTNVDEKEYIDFLSHQQLKRAPAVAVELAPVVTAGERSTFEAKLRRSYGVDGGIWERTAEGGQRPAHRRAVYFPVEFAFPPSQVKALRGFDLGSEEVRREAIERAMRTEAPTMSDPVRPLTRPESRGFLVFAPFYDARRPCSSPPCGRIPRAFSVGAYDYGAPLEAALVGSPLASRDVFIYASRRPDASPVHAHIAERAVERLPKLGELLASHPRSIVNDIEIADRSLRLVVPPSSKQTVLGFQDRDSLAILLLCLALTTVLAGERARAGALLSKVRRSESAYRESERQRTTLLSNIPGAAYRCKNDPSWTMEYLTEGIETLTGYSTREFMGGNRHYGDIIHSEDRDKVWLSVQDALAKHRPWQIEYRITHRLEGDRWVWESGCGVYSTKGELLALEGFVTDITERRRAEESLQQAQKLEAIGRLTGGLAHDFNNLLSLVIGSIDLALMKVKDDEVIVHLNRANDAALRGTGITKSLLAVARRQSMELRPTRVNAVLKDIMPLVRQTAGEDVTVVQDLAEQDTTALIDAGAFTNAVLNLVVNSRDAMPRNGRLVVATHLRTIGSDEAGQAPALPPGRYVIVAVSDNGKGMSEEVRTKAFEPFFTTKERGKGTGLGLSMVYGFAQQAGGTATLYSEPGRGTTVRMYLRAAGPVPEENLSQPSVSPMPAGAERILLVDDEVELLGIAREWLESLGYRVVTCSEPAKALAMLRRESFDLLVTDIVMPGGMDGVQLADEASKLERSPKVLLASGFSEKTASADTLPWRVLEKPYRKTDLAQVVRIVLDAEAVAK